jgi:hypothetical protein
VLKRDCSCALQDEQLLVSRVPCRTRRSCLFDNSCSQAAAAPSTAECIQGYYGDPGAAVVIACQVGFGALTSQLLTHLRLESAPPALTPSVAGLPFWHYYLRCRRNQRHSVRLSKPLPAPATSSCNQLG